MQYLNRFYNAVNKVDTKDFNIIDWRLKFLKSTGSVLYMVGNGGSNAIVSHAAVDIGGSYGILVIPFTDASLITRSANDFGWENVFVQPLKDVLGEDDMVIAVSSSGMSENVIRVAEYAKEVGAFVATFTGFSPENRLSKLGDVNIWIDSNDYGIVEIGTAFLLHTLGKEDYGILG